MSENTIDYKDTRIDPGGDKSFDSSAYGTTTGNLASKPDQGAFGSGNDAASNKQQGQPRAKGVEENITTHSAASGEQGVAGESKTSDEGQAKQVQGYTKTGDMNPEIGA